MQPDDIYAYFLMNAICACGIKCDSSGRMPRFAGDVAKVTSQSWDRILKSFERTYRLVLSDSSFIVPPASRSCSELTLPVTKPGVRSRHTART
jgi:hypothetical protein